jgi:hypothetical protein
MGGNGECVCQKGWTGPACDEAQKDALVALDVDSYTLEDTYVGITLRANRSGSYVDAATLGAQILAMPSAGGRLFQWQALSEVSNNLANAHLHVGEEVLSGETFVSNDLLRVVYLPPPDRNSGDEGHPFDSFNFHLRDFDPDTGGGNWSSQALARIWVRPVPDRVVVPPKVSLSTPEDDRLLLMLPIEDPVSLPCISGGYVDYIWLPYISLPLTSTRASIAQDGMDVGVSPVITSLPNYSDGILYQV